MSTLFSTPEHRALRDTVTRFVDEELNPHVDEWEEAGMYPAHALYKRLGELGLNGIDKPAAFGGLELDYSYVLVYSEELGRVRCGGVPMGLGIPAISTPALARYGSDELRHEFLAPVIAGDMVPCLGVSEPGAGSDVAGLKTHARKDGDDYVINGTKMWITNGMQADWCCLLANTSDGPVHKNKSLIMVPLDTKGVTRQKIDKLGMRSSDTAQLFFDAVRVPQRNRIGKEGHGFLMQMQQFKEERLFLVMGSLKALEIAIDETIAYTRERRVFGIPVLDNQAVYFKLAELQTEIEALRALTYRAAELFIANHDDPEVGKLTSMAKLKGGRLARAVTDGCLQYWGGMGFTWDNPVARLYRDMRLHSIGGGADEVMLGIIAKSMGIFPGRDS